MSCWNCASGNVMVSFTVVPCAVMAIACARLAACGFSAATASAPGLPGTEGVGELRGVGGVIGLDGGGPHYRIAEFHPAGELLDLLHDPGCGLASLPPEPGRPAAPS